MSGPVLASTYKTKLGPSNPPDASSKKKIADAPATRVATASLAAASAHKKGAAIATPPVLTPTPTPPVQPTATSAVRMAMAAFSGATKQASDKMHSAARPSTSCIAPSASALPSSADDPATLFGTLLQRQEFSEAEVFITALEPHQKDQYLGELCVALLKSENWVDAQRIHKTISAQNQFQLLAQFVRHNSLNEATEKQAGQKVKEMASQQCTKSERKGSATVHAAVKSASATAMPIPSLKEVYDHIEEITPVAQAAFAAASPGQISAEVPRILYFRECMESTVQAITKQQSSS